MKSNAERQRAFRERKALKGHQEKMIFFTPSALDVIEQMKDEGESYSDVVNYLVNQYRESLNWRMMTAEPTKTVEDLKNNSK